MVRLANYPEAVAAFAAFHRAQTPADASFAAEAAQIQRLADKPGAAPAVARLVYESGQTRLGVFPATGKVVFVAMAVGNDLAVGVATAFAAANGLGVAHRDAAGFHLWGVLPAGATSASVTDLSGAVLPIELSRDGGYSVVTANAPVVRAFVDAEGAQQVCDLYVQRQPTRHHIPDGDGGLTPMWLGEPVSA